MAHSPNEDTGADEAGPEPARTSPSLRRLWGSIIGVSLLVAVIGAFAVAAVGSDAVPPVTVDGMGTSTIAQPKVAPSDFLPDRGAWVGMTSWPRDDDWSRAGIQRRWNDIEDGVGETLDIGHAYHRWNEEPLITWREEWNVEMGRLSLVSWSQTPVGPVVDGEWDTYIVQQADLVAEFGEPILIRWFWEMDGRQRRAVADNPESWIAAWRHIVGIFRDRDVANAEFVWCPNAWAFDNGDGAQWYPGDDWVDWICADGYNWAPGRERASWDSFTRVFRSFYRWAEPRGKPIIIAETGAQEREAGEKARWIASIPDELESSFPAIDAVVWFDTPVDHDWWIDTSDSSLEAFGTLVRHPYFPGIDLSD